VLIPRSPTCGCAAPPGREAFWTWRILCWSRQLLW